MTIAFRKTGGTGRLRPAESGRLCVRSHPRRISRQGRLFLAIAAVTGLAVVLSACTASTLPTAHKSSAAAHKSTVAPVESVHALRTFHSDAVLLRYGAGSMWEVSSAGSLAELSSDGAVAKAIIPSGVIDAQFVGNDLFALTGTGLSELDPNTGTTLSSVPFASGLAFATNGTMAVILSNESHPIVTAINLMTGTSTTSGALPNPVSNVVSGIIGVDTDGSTWVVDGNALVHVASPALNVLASYPLTLRADDLSLTPAGVFVATQDPEGGVLRLVRGASKVSKCWSDGDALQIVPAGNDLWLSAAAAPTELDQATCEVIAQGPAPDDSGQGLAVSPTEVWIVFPNSHKIEVLPDSQ
jgi:hypothetical protein